MATGNFGTSEGIDQQLTRVINNYIESVATPLSNAMMPAALVGVTLWIMVYGFSVVRGEVQEPINLFVWKVIKVSLILAFASTSRYYMNWVVNGFKGVEQIFIAGISGSSATTVPRAIDNMVAATSSHAAAAFDQMMFSVGPLPIPNIDYLVGWVFIVAGQIIILFACSISYFLAKIYLSIFLALGPPFVLCALWQPTQRFTESWISAVLTQVLVTAIILALLSILPSAYITLTTLTPANMSAEEMTSFSKRGLMLLGLSLVIGYMAMQASNLAAMLTGGSAPGNPISSVAQTVMNKLAFGSNKSSNSSSGGGSIKKK